MRTDTVTALADAAPAPYWLDNPARPPAAGAEDRPAPTWPSSAAASPGCGPRCWPRSATPDATSCCSREPDRLGRQRPQRRVLRGHADPRRGQRPASASRTRTPALRAAGPGEPRRDRGRPSPRYGIDCDFRRSGSLVVATEPHQVGWLRSSQPTASDFLDQRRGARRGGLADVPRRPLRPAGHRAGRTRPAWRGAWPRAAEAAGVRILEQTPGRRRRRATGAGLALRTAHGATVTPHAGRAGHERVPVAGPPAAAAHRAGVRLRPDDRAAVAEPARQPSAGGTGRGVGDLTNQFHYYRLTADNRILWGGYDAIYHFGRHDPARLRPAAGDLRASSPSTSSRRSRSWRGCASPTSGAARSTPAPGSARSSARRSPRRAAYALGYTGLGVGATRFGAEVMLDLLDGEPTPSGPAAHGPTQAAAVPAGAAGLRRHPADPAVAGAGRPRRGRAQPVAAQRSTGSGLGFDS